MNSSSSKTIRIFVLCLCSLCSLACSKESLDPPPPIPQNGYSGCMHPERQISFVKQQIKEENEPYYSAYLQLIYYADSVLNMPVHGIKDFNVPGYYDDPVGWEKIVSQLEEDAFNAYCTALAYTLTGNEQYGIKACSFLNTWASINKSCSGHDGELTMSYTGSGLLQAGELMLNKPVWEEKQIDQFKIWVQNVYQNAANNIRLNENNWGDWGIFASLFAASFLEDSGEIKKNIDLIKSKLPLQISPEGIMPYEINRTYNGQNQALWYTYFALVPITGSLWIIYNLTGENLFTWLEDGKSVKKALDTYLYYFIHPQEWKWSTNKNFYNQSIQDRPNNLIEAMFGIYNEPAYLDFIKSRRPVIYPHRQFVWTFPTLMPLRIGAYEN